MSVTSILPATFYFQNKELFEAIKIDDNGVFAYDVLQKTSVI